MGCDTSKYSIAIILKETEFEIYALELPLFLTVIPEVSRRESSGLHEVKPCLSLHILFEFKTEGKCRKGKGKRETRENRSQYSRTRTGSPCFTGRVGQSQRKRERGSSSDKAFQHFLALLTDMV